MGLIDRKIIENDSTGKVFGMEKQNGYPDEKIINAYGFYQTFNKQLEGAIGQAKNAINLLPDLGAMKNANVPSVKNINPPLKSPKSLNLDISGEKIANIAGAGLGFLGAMLNVGHANVTSEEMIRNGESLQIDGISFNTQRVDSNNAMAAVNAQINQGIFGAASSGMSLGGSIGSIAGPWGTAIGSAVGGIGGAIAGIFGGKRARREAERAKRRAEYNVAANNQYGYDYALTQSLRNKQATKYGNQENLLLYQV